MQLKPPELTEQIQASLTRYIEIQRAEAKLKREKAELAERLNRHLQLSGAKEWFTKVDRSQLKITARKWEKCEYDEELLKGRLGDRYKKILRPDGKKIWRRKEEVAVVLGDFLEEVGVPDPRIINNAIYEGLIDRAEVDGAVKKTERRYVTVQHLNEQEWAAASVM